MEGQIRSQPSRSRWQSNLGCSPAADTLFLAVSPEFHGMPRPISHGLKFGNRAEIMWVKKNFLQLSAALFSSQTTGGVHPDQGEGDIPVQNELE